MDYVFMVGIKNIWNSILGIAIHWKAIIFIHFIQFLISIGVSIAVYSYLKEHLGRSLILDDLQLGFDRTVFTDLLNSNEDVLSWFKLPVVISVLVYLLIGILLQAGWLSNIRKRSFSIRTLIKEGIHLWIPFTGIGMLAFFILILFVGSFTFLFTIVVGDPLQTFSSEKPYVLLIGLLLFLLMNAIILIWSWSVVVRYQVIDGNHLLKAAKSGGYIVKRKFLKYLGIGWLIIGLHLCLFCIHQWIPLSENTSTWMFVLLALIVQQGIHFIRIALRGYGYMMINRVVIPES